MQEKYFPESLGRKPGGKASFRLEGWWQDNNDGHQNQDFFSLLQSKLTMDGRPSNPAESEQLLDYYAIGYSQLPKPTRGSSKAGYQIKEEISATKFQAKNNNTKTEKPRKTETNENNNRQTANNLDKIKGFSTIALADAHKIQKRIARRMKNISCQQIVLKQTSNQQKQKKVQTRDEKNKNKVQNHNYFAVKPKLAFFNEYGANIQANQKYRSKCLSRTKAHKSQEQILTRKPSYQSDSMQGQIQKLKRKRQFTDWKYIQNSSLNLHKNNVNLQKTYDILLHKNRGPPCISGIYSYCPKILP